MHYATHNTWQSGIYNICTTTEPVSYRTHRNELKFTDSAMFVRHNPTANHA